MKPKFYIASAIVYSSKPPHLGNDYELVLADAVARYKRMAGFDVFFSTGTDEHGQKIEEIAKEQGMTPKEYVDWVTGGIINNYRLLNVSYDKFIRTTDAFHEKAISGIFNKMHANGDIYKGEYEGLYCVPCESFYTPSQALEGDLCPDCGRKLKYTKETAYFLKLSKYQEWLAKYLEDHPDFITPEPRKKEMVNNFIKPGLQDLCVTRSSIKWGVPVEFDPEHVIYVWIDALTNYITTLGYDPAGGTDDSLLKQYWPCDLHVIGKDILRFHSIYWPIILKSLGLEMPKKILAHPWVLFGGDRMSKSKGNVVYTSDLVEKYGCDAVRYVLLREMPYIADMNFTEELFVARYNSELANTLGNLVSRTLAMCEKYFGGAIPEPAEASGPLTAEAAAREAAWRAFMEDYRLPEAIAEAEGLLHRANKYIDETEPWILAKSEENRPALAAVIYDLLEAIRHAAVLLTPIMPETSDRIFGALSTDERSLESLSGFRGLVPGSKTSRIPPLFARIEDK